MTRFRVATLAFLLVVTVACAPPPQPTARSNIGARGNSATELIVQAQVDAYNRRDLAAFLKHFARDAKIYTFPDTLLFSGVDTLRAVYGKLFARATGLRAEVTDRVVQGRFVIDREITSGLPGRGALTGVAIYEVRNGLITRVWFLD